MAHNLSLLVLTLTATDLISGQTTFGPRTDERADCQFVTHNPSKSECYLKRHDTGRLARLNYTSAGCRSKSTFIVSCDDTVSDPEDPHAVIQVNNGPGNMCYDIDCPLYIEEFIRYTSADIPNGHYTPQFVESEEQCAELCKKRSNACKFFTYDRSGEADSGCHLKACDGGREVANSNFRSGGYQCLRQDQSCPPKWTQVGDVCVHYNKYRWNFDFAKKFCIETGGQLYEPRNATTEAAIRSWIANFQGFFPGNKGPWIGVTDITSEGNFVYASDNQPITLSSWKPGQPDNNSGTDPNGQDCVYYHLNKGNPLWNDIKCSAKTNPLCERPVQN